MPHILIIEPDRLLAGELKRYFANANYTSSAHSDPQAAVIAADQQAPDVIIAELQLAGRSGVEFLYEFRSYPDWQAIPIIIYTNLHSERISGHQDVFEMLNIATSLHKSQTSLADLLGAVQQAIAVHAKI